MGLTESLAGWGILRPDITTRAAADAGLELAAACTVVFRETSGGRMVWGGDGKPAARRTDALGQVIYEFGGPVTPDNYLRYRAAQRARLIPRQGVGDCQLTSEDYLARAEQLGGPAGPADPYFNQRAGFAGLAALITRYGVRDGFVAYNGGPGAIGKAPTHPAQQYADKAMTALAVWRSRLGSLNTKATTVAPAPGKDWFDVATEADLRRIVEEVVGARLDTIVHEVTLRLASRVDFGLLHRITGHPVPTEAEKATDTVLGQATNSDARGYEVRDLVLNKIIPALDQLLAAPQRPAAVPTVQAGVLSAEFVFTGTARPATT